MSATGLRPGGTLSGERQGGATRPAAGSPCGVQGLPDSKDLDRLLLRGGPGRPRYASPLLGPAGRLAREGTCVPARLRRHTTRLRIRASLPADLRERLRRADRDRRASSSRASWSPTVARKILLTLLVLGALGADQRCGDVLGLLEHGDELRERLRSRHRADRRQRRGQRDAVPRERAAGLLQTRAACSITVLGLAALEGAPVRLDRRTARAVPDADDHARHGRDRRSSTTAPASRRTRPTTSARARE